VRDNINRVYYQCYETNLEKPKGGPNVNICAAEENLEEEL